MPAGQTWRLTDFATCAGCAGKIAAGAISHVLGFLPRSNDPNLLVGAETRDDAGVYRLTDEIALVQTLDFFPPVVDDPFIYGQIAAANALSDVYAMGGEPKTALNLLGYPDDELESWEWLGDILRGAGERCQTSGAVVLGGHSVRDREIKFGLAVTGVVHPKRIWTNAAAQPGDKLVLTKPLGTGFATTAAKKNACPPDVLQAACESMIQLNAIGRDALLASGGDHAVTDITGFGLCGHGFEMADGAKVTLAIDVASLPLIPGIVEHGLTKFRTRASRSNWDYVKQASRMEGTVDPVLVEFLCDPQTSGGLLISVEPSRANVLVEELRQRGALAVAVVGEVREKVDDVSLVWRFK